MIVKKCLVIFSGGQDSTTCLGWAKKKFKEVVAINFNYGQNHSIEVTKAKEICSLMDIELKAVDVSFYSEIVTSALVSGGNVNVKHKDNNSLPASFVPNRNAFFITIAHAYAQKIGAEVLVTGVCETDYSGYPDCRREFIDSIEETLNLASEQNIEILTPLMTLNKAEVWTLSEELGILDIVLNYSITCYNGNQEFNEWGFGCGKCPSCLLRKKGFEDFMNQK